MHPNKAELEIVKEKIKTQAYLCKCIAASDSYMGRIEALAGSFALFYGERDMVIGPDKDWSELGPEEQDKVIADFYKEHKRSGLTPEYNVTGPRDAEEALKEVFLKWPKERLKLVHGIVSKREREKLEELKNLQKELKDVYEERKFEHADQPTLFDMNDYVIETVQ